MYCEISFASTKTRNHVINRYQKNDVIYILTRSKLLIHVIYSGFSLAEEELARTNTLRDVEERKSLLSDVEGLHVLQTKLKAGKNYLKIDFKVSLCF